MGMKNKLERLNGYIDGLHAGYPLQRVMSPAQRLRAESGPPGIAQNDEVEIMQFAALLAALRPGAARPDPEFLVGLRSRMLAEAAGGMNLAP